MHPPQEPSTMVPKPEMSTIRLDNMEHPKLEAPYRDNIDIEGSPNITPLLVEDGEPDEVDYDGPEDPDNPMNWPYWKKVVTVIILCAVRMVV